MGHLINPIGVRLGLNYTWESIWVNEQVGSEHRDLVGTDLKLHKYLKVLTNNKRLWKFGLFISHFRIFRLKGRIIVALFAYDGAVYTWQTYLSKSYKKWLRNKNYIINQNLKKLTFNRKYKNLRKFLLSELYKIIKKRLTNGLYLSRLLVVLYYKFWFERNLKSRFGNKYNCLLLWSKISNITASTAANFIAIKLKQHFKLNNAVNPVLKALHACKNVEGYKVQCAGRFTRKQMAETVKFGKGRIPLNTFSSKVDYAAATVILKYSLCGIKVWINYKNIKDKYRIYC